jgi:hypothetical protein
MTNHTDLGTAPPLPSLAPLLSQISAAHALPDDELLTEDAILSSITFLSSLPPEIHWLCTTTIASPSLIPVVAQAVQLWGYGEPAAQTKLATFKPIFTATLARCAGCAVEWQTSLRRELKRALSDVYSYDKTSTEGFFVELENWDVERLGAALNKAEEFVGIVPMGWKHGEVRVPVIECLAQPRLLLREKLLREWKVVVLGLERVPLELMEKWFPGAIFLIFDADERIMEIGEKMFRKRDTKISSDEFESEIFKPLLELVTNLSQQACAILWQ